MKMIDLFVPTVWMTKEEFKDLYPPELEENEFGLWECDHIGRLDAKDSIDSYKSIKGKLYD